MPDYNVTLTRIDPNGEEEPYIDMFSVPADVINKTCGPEAVIDLFKRAAADYVAARTDISSKPMPAGTLFTISDFMSIPNEFLAKYGITHETFDSMLNVAMTMDETLAEWPAPEKQTGESNAFEENSLLETIWKQTAKPVLDMLSEQNIQPEDELRLALNQCSLWTAQILVNKHLDDETHNTKDLVLYGTWCKALNHLNACSDQYIRDCMSDACDIMTVIPSDNVRAHIKLLQIMALLEKATNTRILTPVGLYLKIMPYIQVLRNAVDDMPDKTGAWKDQVVDRIDRIEKRMAVLHN